MSRSSLPVRLKFKVQDAWQKARFNASVRHLHGPTQLETDEADVIVMAQVRDGMYYLDAFFDHYRGLGVEHFVFFDNGSTDGTIDRIKSEPGTIIDQSKLPFGIYEGFMRDHVARTYGRNRWCLYADMDEIFDFEGATRIGIEGLVAYLTAEGYSALVAQMLEMFPRAPLRDVANLPYVEVLSAFDHYDISTLKRLNYHDPDAPFADLLRENEIAVPEIQFVYGGVRGKVFGETCCLTKHPLVFNGTSVKAGFHPHFSLGVRCADITAVLKHYKFANDAAGRDVANLAHAAFTHGEDLARMRRLSETPDISLYSEDAQVWNGIGPLLDKGFLLGSERYAAHIAKAMS